MNIKQLDSILSSLTGKRDEIMKIASFCNNQPESASLITFMIQTEFLKAPSDRKKIYLYLIHQIILQEHQLKRKSIDYIKAIGFKLRLFFQDFINTNSIEDLDNSYTIIRRWEKEGIYHPHFLIKMRLVLQPRYDEIKNKQKELQHLQHEQERNNRIMHHEVKKIQVRYFVNMQSMQAPNQILNYLIQQQTLDQKMLHFTEKKLQSKKMKDLNALIEEGEQCKTSLINSICLLQNTYFNISLQGEQLINQCGSRIDFYKKMRKKLYQCQHKNTIID